MGTAVIPAWIQTGSNCSMHFPALGISFPGHGGQQPAWHGAGWEHLPLPRLLPLPTLSNRRRGTEMHVFTFSSLCTQLISA